MKIKNISVIYFSPTGQTGKVTREMGKKLSTALHLSMYSYDISLLAQREQIYQFEEDELVIVGFPVYAGRLPNKILPFIKGSIKGDHTYVIPLLTYGNRHYEGALAELHDVLFANQFIPIGASAVVCNHVFSSKMAPNRPNQKDWDKLDSLLERVIVKLEKERVEAPISIKGHDLQTVYYQPLGEDGRPVYFLKAKPVTDEDQCLSCGKCASFCPMGAISQTNPILVTGTCIKCHACIKNCPVGAKSFKDSAFLSHVKMLESHYQKPQDSEIFV